MQQIHYSRREWAARYAVFLIGLFFCSLGVSFSTKGNLGTTPISSIPYTLSLYYRPTIGQFTYLFSALLILIQVLILRRKFGLRHILQLPAAFFFGFFTDVTMSLLHNLNPEAYPARLLVLLIGCVILAFGIALQVVADVAMLPGEGFVKTVSGRLNTDYGYTKVAFDSTMTVCAAIIALLLFHRLTGVREGTVIAAVIIGMLVRRCLRRLRPLQRMLDGMTEKEEAA